MICGQWDFEMILTFQFKYTFLQGEAKEDLQWWVHETHFIPVLLFNNYIMFHMNSYKPIFTPPCIVYEIYNNEY